LGNAYVALEGFEPGRGGEPGVRRLTPGYHMPPWRATILLVDQSWLRWTGWGYVDPSTKTDQHGTVEGYRKSPKFTGGTGEEDRLLPRAAKAQKQIPRELSGRRPLLDRLSSLAPVFRREILRVSRIP